MNTTNNIKSCIKEYNSINTTNFTSILTRTLLCSILASNGLLNNSITSLITAMIISPIGSLIIDLSFFLVSKILVTKKHVKILSSLGSTSLLPMLLLLLLIIIIIILISILYGYFYTEYYKIDLPTKEMKSRGEHYIIFETILIAFACAIAFPSAFQKKDVSTLIAIAISTALAVPISNIGIYIGTYYNKPEYYDKKINIKNITKNNLIIFIINFIALFIASLLYIYNRCINFNRIKLAPQADFI